MQSLFKASLEVLTHLMHKAMEWKEHYYLHFIDKETKETTT